MIHAGCLPAFVAGAQAHVRGTLVAAHFRDERGFAVFSVQQAARSRVRALGHLPTDVSLHAVVRIGGIWTEHPQYGWQVRCNTVELVRRLGPQWMIAFLASHTKHLGRVRAAGAVALFGDRVFEVLKDNPIPSRCASWAPISLRLLPLTASPRLLTGVAPCAKAHGSGQPGRWLLCRGQSVVAESPYRWYCWTIVLRLAATRSRSS